MSTYEERCAALGIERPPSLARGFPAETLSVLPLKKGLTKAMGPRAKPADIQEDLTHMNPRAWEKCRANIRRWWSSLSAEQKQALSEKRGHKSSRDP